LLAASTSRGVATASLKLVRRDHVHRAAPTVVSGPEVRDSGLVVAVIRWLLEQTGLP